MQCVPYAKKRYEEISGKDCPTHGWDANEYWANAVNTYPHARKWSIAVWFRNDGGYGHVGVIEEVYSDGTVLYSDANRWNDEVIREGERWEIYNLGRMLGSNYTFKGYIAY